MGKKKPRTNSRRNSCGDAASEVIIEGLALIGAYDGNGHVAQPVICDWKNKHCGVKLTGETPKTGSISCTRTHVFDAIENPGSTDHLVSGKNETPKRWYDVSPTTRLFMTLASVKYDNTPHRKLTFYIGRKLIDHSISKGLGLAGYINKRIQRSLKAILGDVGFGVWFQLEPSPNPPFALHGHGIIYVEDETWFKKSSSKRRRLVKALKRATGEDGSMYASNWLDIPDGEIDAYWLTYCTKGTWGPKFFDRYPPAPKEIGTPVYAITHSFRRRRKKFYERMRPLMCAIASNALDDFGEDDWYLLNQNHPDLGLRSLPFSIRWRHKIP